jgi:hypothetical protein
MIKNIHSSSRKVAVILVRDQLNSNTLGRFSKKYSNTKFLENPSNGSRIVPCGRADGQNDEAKVAFRNYLNAPKT